MSVSSETCCQLVHTFLIIIQCKNLILCNVWMIKNCSKIETYLKGATNINFTSTLFTDMYWITIVTQNKQLIFYTFSKIHDRILFLTFPKFKP